MRKNKFLLFTICLMCFFGFKFNVKALDREISSKHYDSSIVSKIKNKIDEVNNYNQIYLILYNNVDNNYYFPIRQYNSQHSTFDKYFISFFDYSINNTTNNYVISDPYYTRLDFYSYNSRYDTFTKITQNWWYSGYQNSNKSTGMYRTIKYLPDSSYFNYDFVYSSTQIYINTISSLFSPTINDVVLNTGDIVSITEPVSPTISISNLTPIKDNLNNIIKYTVDVSFSVFDTNNYKYQYCLDNDCQDFSSNNINLELYKNGSYVFQILDNNDELIDSTSLTISNINIETPFIDYSLSISPTCVAFIDNQTRNVCKTLQMKQGTSNPNYFYQYSVNNLDFENFYGSYSINLVQGDTVILRVIDSSNNVIWTSSFTINDLYTIDTSLGIFATFNLTSFGKSDYNSKYVEIYLYNLDLNYIDNVYISYNGFSFEKLDVSNKGSYFFAITKDITKSQQIYLNVKNDNNEIIYTTSYYVDLTSISKPSLLTFLENFNVSMSGPISNLVTAPIRLFSSLTDYYGTCVPLPLPSSIGTFNLPCMSEVYSAISIDLYNIVRLIFDGIICYYCSINIIYTIKCLLSPTDDRIEVIKL